MEPKAWFAIREVDEKIRRLPDVLSSLLTQTDFGRGEIALGRDVPVVMPAELPPKPGLASLEGQARLLHDLASIELQAMELAVRTLYEFPDAALEFRKELADLALDEGKHLGLCLRDLRDLGFNWGSWPAHLALWQAVSPEDTLLDRILIVHRYLEGSGLDAGDSILRRLVGVPNKFVRETVKTIVDEEVAHVSFGSRWYRRVAEDMRIDPERDFAERMAVLVRTIPRKERIAADLRRRAGFTDYEISVIESARFAYEKGEFEIRTH